jgi:hypothetical protein
MEVRRSLEAHLLRHLAVSTSRQISFADIELMRRGVRLEPLLELPPMQ